ncbi:MAG: DNA methyltransferase, partial [Candidatus Omnitrophota bacterium]
SFNVALTGFKEDELQEIFGHDGGPPADAEPQIDRAEELNKTWRVKSGDLWQIGAHRLLCGDSTLAADVKKVMGGEKADAVVTDPPYGINREGIENDDPEGLAKLFNGCLSALPSEDAVIIAFQSPRLFHVWFDACRNHGIKFERLLWMHRKAGKAFPWRGWVLVGDPIQVSSIGNAKWGDPEKHEFDCYIKEELEPKELDGLHTTIKPLRIISDLISHTTGTVYEPFSGSGTCLVACQNLNRKCRGIEVSAPYVAVCLERMSQAFPGIEIKLLERA